MTARSSDTQHTTHTDYAHIYIRQRDSKLPFTL